MWSRLVLSQKSVCPPFVRQRLFSTGVPNQDLSLNSFFKNVPEGYTQPMPAKYDTIIISMSSGVDSSVTALMYSKMYANVKGVFMANWSSESKGTRLCTVDRDWEQVQETCKQINIPCERVNFESAYWEDVFVPMLNMYKNGLTPNPDVDCNKYVKFGKMIEHLSRQYDSQTNADGSKWWLVTGHYARILRHDKTGEYHLLRGDYKKKDQSYYLSQMPSNILSRVLLPIGHIDKPTVRKIAEESNLLTSHKPDSQGLCFVSQTGHFREFLNEYLEPNPGDIVTADGKVWGKHEGLWYGTIGQRSGISMPQGDPKYKGTWLISDKDIEKNQLIISHKDDLQAFLKDTIEVEEWEWLSEKGEKVSKFQDLGDDIKLEDTNVQFRSLMSPISVKEFTVDENNSSKVHVVLDSSYRGIAPGQNLVLYHNDRVLGSGVIMNMSNSTPLPSIDTQK